MCCINSVKLPQRAKKGYATVLGGSLKEGAVTLDLAGKPPVISGSAVLPLLREHLESGQDAAVAGVAFLIACQVHTCHSTERLVLVLIKMTEGQIRAIL